MHSPTLYIGAAIFRIAPNWFTQWIGMPSSIAAIVQ
jgi:hypothetical protein